MKIAFIPVRKGSKRCPQKNISNINGLPLFDLTIQQSLRLKFDFILLSTDDKFVENYIKKKYCHNELVVHLRNASLADDRSTILEVIQNVIMEYEFQDMDDLYLLQVTNPLREDIDVINAEDVYRYNEKVNSVVSVTEVDFPVETTLVINKSNQLIFTEPVPSIRKQDFGKRFRYNDAVIIDSVGRWKNLDRNLLFGERPIPYHMPPERSLYIDFPWQLELVKLIMENKNYENNEQSNSI